ncbi:ABC transporter substrate binding protein [Bradyrhizobium sp. JYMT SZCCT0428]|uniref:ABC transporter substrate binding protein n=1 Tax=Bradyrhizobium sp. JYMT SZCCT0428 TaxID=2807673 RepID=UPI001BAAD57B|nr:hypothetical protein [Bradyrhizobium sp. JYMT SZCCT0428]
MGAWVQAGGLISYGPNVAEMIRKASRQLDAVLKGANPGDLPVQQPTRFELFVNLKTAKALGLDIPEAFLLRADKLIEQDQWVAYWHETSHEDCSVSALHSPAIPDAHKKNRSGRPRLAAYLSIDATRCRPMAIRRSGYVSTRPMAKDLHVAVAQLSSALSNYPSEP